MKRAALVLLAVLLTASCATQDLQAPCKRPAFTQQLDDCGPLKRFP